MPKSPEEMAALQETVNTVSTKVWTVLTEQLKGGPTEGEAAFLHAAGAGQGGMMFSAEMAMRTQMTRAAFVDLAGRLFDQVKAHTGG